MGHMKDNFGEIQLEDALNSFSSINVDINLNKDK